MPIPECFCHLLKVDPKSLTKQENSILEAELFIYFFEQVKNIFRRQYKEYFQLIKLNIVKEEKMLNEKFIWYVINDIISTGEYNLAGIAYYTNTPEEIIKDIYFKESIIPSFILCRKILEIHKIVKPKLYMGLAKKVAIAFIQLLKEDMKENGNLSKFEEIISENIVV